MASNSMEALLASLEGKSLTINRGDQVKGTIIAETNLDFIIDLGTKAEGLLPKKELYGDAENLKIGDKVEAFVISPENDSGQVLLSFERQTGRPSHSKRVINWSKFTSAMNQGKKLHGHITEINKGGLVVEIDGVRGFLPSSQVSFENISNLNDLVGQDVAVAVLEVDPNNNRLILTDRETPTTELQDRLSQYQEGQKVSGEVVAVLSFGVVLNVDGLEGLVYINESSWDKVDDIQKLFKVGDKVDAVVLNADFSLGRLNLSIKRLSQDPFSELSEKYQPDDVVKATVKEVNENGVVMTLSDGIEGLMGREKMDGTTNYEIGQQITCLIDGVDPRSRKITLAPMLTTTSGLIYK